MADVPTPSSTVHTAGPLEEGWLNDPLNYMVKAFIAFLQTIFETAPAGHFHWRPELEETEIVITEENPVKTDSIEQKPVISVILGPTRFNGSSLDDLVHVSITDAKEIHTDLIPGTMSLNCVSRVPQECRFIAWICARTIWNLRKLFIREPFIHDVGRNISVGPVTPAGALVAGDTEGEWHSVSVSCPFFLQWTDRVTPLQHDWSGRPIHLLKQVAMKFTTRLNEAQPNLTHTQNTGLQQWGDQVTQPKSLRPPSMRGRRIQTEPHPSSQSSSLEVKTKV
jgi:hypothetical protein